MPGLNTTLMQIIIITIMIKMVYVRRNYIITLGDPWHEAMQSAPEQTKM